MGTKGCDLYELSSLDGWMQLVPPTSVEAVVAKYRNGTDRLKWLPIDSRLQGKAPHPMMPDGWEAALLRLDAEPQCLTSAVTLIRECTSLSASRRPPMTRIRMSEVFG